MVDQSWSPLTHGCRGPGPLPTRQWSPGTGLALHPRPTTAARKEHVQARGPACHLRAIRTGFGRSLTVSHGHSCHSDLPCSSIGGGQHEWEGCARSPPGTILPCPADRCGPCAPRDRERRTASAPGRDRSHPACPLCALTNGHERSTAVNLGSCRSGPGLSIRPRPALPSPADRASQARSGGTRAALRTAGHVEQPRCDDPTVTTAAGTIGHLGTAGCNGVDPSGATTPVAPMRRPERTARAAPEESQ